MIFWNILKKFLRPYGRFLRNPRELAYAAKNKDTKKGTDFSIPSALNQLNTKSFLLKPR